MTAFTYKRSTTPLLATYQFEHCQVSSFFKISAGVAALQYIILIVTCFHIQHTLNTSNLSFTMFAFYQSLPLVGLFALCHAAPALSNEPRAAALSCPSSNMTTYITSSNTYIIECFDRPGGDMASPNGQVVSVSRTSSCTCHVANETTESRELHCSMRCADRLQARGLYPQPKCMLPQERSEQRHSQYWSLGR